jgi:hypothetical protein
MFPTSKAKAMKEKKQKKYPESISTTDRVVI